MFGTTMKVREIASAATRDQDFLPQPIRMLQHGDAPSPLAGFDGAHQPRRTPSENQRVESLDHGRSHIKQAEPRQMIFFEKFLLHVLFL